MTYYLLLTVSTALIGGLALLIWAKTRSISFPLGIGLLYYWSLYGAWFIVHDKLVGKTGLKYAYLEERMFPIHLDDSYFWSLALYAAFVLVVEVTLLLAVRSPRKSRPKISKPPCISHRTILVFTAITGVASVLLIVPAVRASLDVGLSPYAVVSTYAPTRRGVSGLASGLYTLHQFLLQISLVVLALGVAVLCSGRNPRLLAGRGGRWSKLGYLFLLSALISFAFLLGQKSELFLSGVMGSLFYLANAERLRIVPLSITAIIGVLVLGLINISRGMPIPELPKVLFQLDAKNLLETIGTIMTSNEAFAAHFSMYGALASDIPPKFGYSLLSLIASVIPRLLWPGRPGPIYNYYAKSLNLTPGQGYAIHHATGWYLNFGLPGVVIGAAILGLVWAKCFNSYIRVNAALPRWRYIFSILAPWIFVGYVPQLVRGSPEGYKGLIVEGFLIPTVVLILASYRWRILPRPSGKGETVGSKCLSPGGT